ncbi:putative transporter YwrA [Halobacillus andaensis]|uniref:Transporter YwrA n=1 Tax=Halobacillus andaensis TaxID=1176239 RepID=A0A917EWH8_HALAA|nr:chromate transporter [Halobacillus andaensis]MBP2005887.1 chromate transporter [Halobacillus andaensis]GGF25315.1 putative transporter YwrA [Halobacillus andaensis]
MQQWNLFLAFFRVGIFGYGGGPSSIPLVHKEVVEKYKWMTDDEFADVLALGNSLPGPIATKMAGYIGYRVSGFTGMMNAVLATILPTIAVLIILLSFLNNFRELSWVNGMTQAVVPVVGVMLAVLAFDFVKKSKQNLGVWVTLLIGTASLLLIEGGGVHPGLVILVLLLFALLRPMSKKGTDRDEYHSKEVSK